MRIKRPSCRRRDGAARSHRPRRESNLDLPLSLGGAGAQARDCANPQCFRAIARGEPSRRYPGFPGDPSAFGQRTGLAAPNVRGGGSGADGEVRAEGWTQDMHSRARKISGGCGPTRTVSTPTGTRATRTRARAEHHRVFLRMDRPVVAGREIDDLGHQSPNERERNKTKHDGPQPSKSLSSRTSQPISSSCRR